MSVGHAKFRVADGAPKGKRATIDTPDHDRAMLLELATDLQRWPARNLVFRKALDRAARDIAHLASEAETG